MNLRDIKTEYEPLYLVYNKREWQLEREHKVLGFNWTDEEIENAVNGLIGTKFGVKCYVSKSLSTG